MKLPSISYLVPSAKVSLKRFPLTIIASFFAVVLAVYMVEYNNDIKNLFPYINLMLTLSLGIPLYFCATIISNKKRFNKKSTIIIQTLATLILIVVYYTLPNAVSTHNTSLPYIKYGIYNINPTVI